jgi:hypothetical protein
VKAIKDNDYDKLRTKMDELEKAAAFMAQQGQPGGTGEGPAASDSTDKKDDDVIELNVMKRTMTLKVTEEEIAKRRAAWKKPALNAKKGLLFKFAQRTTTAAQGCVTDALPESYNLN